MTDSHTASGSDLAASALRLHTAVPAATDHPYRQLASPARTEQHLARRHRLELEGEHGELLREHFTSPQQLHWVVHEPTETRAILAIALDPFVDQLLDIIGQLPAELAPILLAATALAVRLGETHAPLATGPPAGGGQP